MAKVPERFSQGHRIPLWPDHLPRAHRCSLHPFSVWARFSGIPSINHAINHPMPRVMPFPQRGRKLEESKATEGGDPSHQAFSEDILITLLPDQVRQGNNARTSFQARVHTVQTGHSLPVSILHKTK